MENKETDYNIKLKNNLIKVIEEKVLNYRGKEKIIVGKKIKYPNGFKRWVSREEFENYDAVNEESITF